MIGWSPLCRFSIMDWLLMRLGHNCHRYALICLFSFSFALLLELSIAEFWWRAKYVWLNSGWLPYINCLLHSVRRFSVTCTEWSLMSYLIYLLFFCLILYLSILVYIRLLSGLLSVFFLSSQIEVIYSFLSSPKNCPVMSPIPYVAYLMTLPLQFPKAFRYQGRLSWSSDFLWPDTSDWYLIPLAGVECLILFCAGWMGFGLICQIFNQVLDILTFDIKLF